MVTSEQIVFVDENGIPTGEIGPKLESHTADTKLHLAFSCYVFRLSDHKFLLTQRARTKKVWPGVWTNSVCGHPAPTEPIEDAVRRRAQFELGLDHLEYVTCIVPVYRYITPPYKGIVEHEFCPIFVAYTATEPQPNPEEVEAYQWRTWPEYSAFLSSETNVSYWAKDQYQHLQNLEPFATLAKP